MKRYYITVINHQNYELTGKLEKLGDAYHFVDVDGYNYWFPVVLTIIQTKKKSDVVG